MTQLDDVWRRIEAFGATIRSIPVEQIAVALRKYEREILAIVETDTGRDLDGSDATPAPSSSPEPVSPGVLATSVRDSDVQRRADHRRVRVDRH